MSSRTSPYDLQDKNYDALKLVPQTKKTNFFKLKSKNLVTKFRKNIFVFTLQKINPASLNQI